MIDGLGFAGGESRILSMGQGFDRTRFVHSVLTVNSALYSAPEEFQARRSQYLQAGISVDDLSEAVPERPLPWKGVPGKLYRKTGILRRTRRLARLLRDWQVDVIDSHLESAGLVSVLAGRMARVPVSMTMYCGAWLNRRNPDAMNWSWMTRAALRFADGVMTDSQIRSKQMSLLVPGQQEKFRVIPNGIPQPQSARSSAEMRAMLGLPADPGVRVIAQIGRFTEYKGQAVLLRAARKILDLEPNTAFLMVGFAREESYKPRLRELADSLGIAGRVVMTHYAGNIGDIWQVVDIHAHASLFDSLPISIAESMSLGKPAVVTSAGGIPEIVQDGETGLIVPPGDADALANGLLRILREPELARRLGEGAARRYQERYRPATMVRALEEYLSELAARRKRSVPATIRRAPLVE